MWVTTSCRPCESPTNVSSQCYRSAWQYASSFSSSLSTPSADSHIVALHQALIPNWTSPAFSKFVDASRALVDELANITTAHDGKEEMVRCEEIFRQICWLEERFWPDVDGMGEEDDSVRPGPPGLGNMNNGNFTRPMNQNVGGPMGNHPMNNQMNGQLSNGPMNTGPMNVPMNSNGMNRPMNNNGVSGMGNNSMNGQMNNNALNGQMSNGLNGTQMNGQNMNGQSMNGNQMTSPNINGNISGNMNGSDGLS